MEVQVIHLSPQPHQGWMMLALFLATALTTGLPVFKWGRKGWWIAILAALFVPTAIIVPFGESLPSEIWTAAEFFVDVTLPLALMASPGTFSGLVVAIVLRRRRTRLRNAR